MSGGGIRNCLNLPNLISFFRILLIPPFVYFFLNENYIMVAALLCLSGISDMLDGLTARLFNQATKVGKILDPIADKLTLVAIVACLGVKFKELLPLVALLIVKDVLMLLAGYILVKKNIEPIPAKWYGKVGTAIFYVSATIIVVRSAFFEVADRGLPIVLLSLTAGFMLFALIRYYLLFKKVFKEDEKNKSILPQNN